MGSFTWNTSVTRNLHYRCYWDGSTGQVGGAAWFSGSERRSGWVVQWTVGGTGSAANASGSGVNYSHGNGHTVTIYSEAYWYTEGVIPITRTGSNVTWSGFTGSPDGALCWNTTGTNLCTSSAGSAEGGGSGSSRLSAKWVAWSLYESGEMPAYRWVDDEYSPVTPFCGADVSYSTPDHFRLRAGDTVTFTTAYTPGTTGLVEAQFREGGPWIAIHVPGSLSNPDVFAYTLPALPAGYDGGYRLMGQVRLRCYNTATDATAFKSASAASSEIDAGPSRPCEQTFVTWPTLAIHEVGDEVGWYLYHVNIGWTGDPDIVVEVATWDSSSADSPGPMAALTWEELATLAPGTAGTYEAEAGYDAPTTQFVLRCTDEVGTVYSGRWASGARLLGPDDLRTEESCRRVSVGLRPSSWVPGLVSALGCTLKALFIPSEGDLEQLRDRLDEIRDRPPVQWVDAGVTYVTSASFGFATWSSAGPACFEIMDTEVCPRTWDSGEALPAWFLAVVLFGLWTGVVVAVWRWF